MILADKQNIEDLIIESLATQPYQTGPELVKSINKKRGVTTKQAVYFVLSPLLDSEVIAKVGVRYYLSKLWLDKVFKLLQVDFHHHVNEPVFSLAEGETINYQFPSLLTCDMYWAHVFNLLVVDISQNTPFFFWLPHEWLILGRREEELEIFKLIHRYRKTGYYCIAGNTSLDKEFKKKYTTEFIRVNIGNQLPFKNNYYLNVFGDTIIEIYLDTKLARHIDDFYQSHSKASRENIQDFKKLIQEKFPVRMKISKNKKRAAKLRKQMAKDFYIPGHLTID